MDRNGRHLTVRAYAWNLTHGGGANRPAHEYRIQITSGVSVFEPEPAGVTLILGWSEAFGVYAAFDIDHHTATLGSSPSIQISSRALQEAAKIGMASYKKSSGEVAVAVRPDFLARYIADHAAAHRGDLSALDEPPAPAEADKQPDFMAMAHPARSHRLGHAEELRSGKGCSIDCRA
jgi:putative restriction endonuclease